MAMNFIVVSRATGEEMIINDVDAQMCECLNVTVHSKRYGGGMEAYDWYNNVCYYLADWHVTGTITPEIQGKLMARMFEIFDGSGPGDCEFIAMYSKTVHHFGRLYAIKTWRS